MAGDPLKIPETVENLVKTVATGKESVKDPQSGSRCVTVCGWCGLIPDQIRPIHPIHRVFSRHQIDPLSPLFNGFPANPIDEPQTHPQGSTGILRDPLGSSGILKDSLGFFRAGRAEMKWLQPRGFSVGSLRWV